MVEIITVPNLTSHKQQKTGWCTWKKGENLQRKPADTFPLENTWVIHYEPQNPVHPHTGYVEQPQRIIAKLINIKLTDGWLRKQSNPKSQVKHNYEIMNWNTYVNCAMP